ncbi:MAG TPA: hypothetical protein VGM30_19595 [Puia sp.]|jgi:hypothetical protein
MKRIIIGCGWLVLVLPARAQTFSEWFRQNSTRLEYYAKQIVAWQVSIREMEKGSGIADAGLALIGTGKQGEYDAHNGYYTSLRAVNPALRKMADIDRIATLQILIVGRFGDALGRYRRDGLLGTDQLTYIGNVYNTVLQAGLRDVETLTELLTAGDWQVTDDQRMARIIELRTAMEDRYAFTLAFTDGMDMEERNKAVEGTGVGTLKTLYGVP